MLWGLQWYMTLHALVCLLQFATAKIRVCWFWIQIMWFEVGYTSEKVRDQPTNWSAPWHMTSYLTSLMTVLPSIHYPLSSVTLWWPGSSLLTNWVRWRERRHDDETGEGWCDDGWKMGPGDTQQRRPQPLPVLHPQPDFAQCQLLRMLVPWHYSIDSLRFTSFLR